VGEINQTGCTRTPRRCRTSPSTRSAGPRSSGGRTEEVAGRPVRGASSRGPGTTRRRCTRTCRPHLERERCPGDPLRVAAPVRSPRRAGRPDTGTPWYPHSTLCRRVVASMAAARPVLRAFAPCGERGGHCCNKMAAPDQHTAVNQVIIALVPMPGTACGPLLDRPASRAGWRRRSSSTGEVPRAAYPSRS